MHSSNALMVSCLALCIVSASIDSARGCACCTNAGQRRVELEKLSSGQREELSRLRFSARARLFLGEGEPVNTEGLLAPSGSYMMEVDKKNDRWIFRFRDARGRKGTLILILPETVAMFEIDPRTTPDRGHGPLLFKEWRLTSRAIGTGIFAHGVGRGQSLSLIMQGTGNSCTSADDFTHWTLLSSGSKAKFHFFGELSR